MFHKNKTRGPFIKPAPTSQSSTSPPASTNSNNISITKFLITTVTGSIGQQLATLLCSPLAILYYFLVMNAFYHVMGAVRCPKIKKHAGIRLRPINKAKEPFSPNDMLLFTCESTEETHSIKCLDDGHWSDVPHCPDPVNNTCPDLGPISHGYHNATGSPLRVGTVIAFMCEKEILPGINPALFSIPSTTTTTTTTTSTTTSSMSSQPSDALANYSMTISARDQQLSAVTSETGNGQLPLRYNLTGHRLLKCLPSSKWNHQMPSCSPIYPEPVSNVSFVLTSALLIILPILMIATIIQLFLRWRKRQQQRARWKQYFTDYKYRHSKTSITFAMRPQSSNAKPTIPVTDL